MMEAIDRVAILATFIFNVIQYIVITGLKGRVKKLEDHERAMRDNWLSGRDLGNFGTTYELGEYARQRRDKI